MFNFLSTIFGRRQEYRVFYTDRHPGANVYSVIYIMARSEYDAARIFDTVYTEYQRQGQELV